jgi:hypothetical protein
MRTLFSLALARMLAESSKCVVYSSPDSVNPAAALLSQSQLRYRTDSESRS